MSFLQRRKRTEVDFRQRLFERRAARSRHAAHRAQQRAELDIFLVRLAVADQAGDPNRQQTDRRRDQQRNARVLPLITMQQRQQPEWRSAAGS